MNSNRVSASKKASPCFRRLGNNPECQPPPLSAAAARSPLGSPAGSSSGPETHSMLCRASYGTARSDSSSAASAATFSDRCSAAKIHSLHCTRKSHAVPRATRPRKWGHRSPRRRRCQSPRPPWMYAWSVQSPTRQTDRCLRREGGPPLAGPTGRSDREGAGTGAGRRGSWGCAGGGTGGRAHMRRGAHLCE